MFKGLGIWQSNLSPSNVYPLWALPIMGTAPSSFEKLYFNHVSVFQLFLPKKKKKVQKDEVKKFSSAPNGIYMFGSVGCGKTMLMDMFYETCQIDKKQRVHFHQFMLDVHQRIHEVQSAKITLYIFN